MTLQGFPDEFHLGTLDTLIAAFSQLQSGARLHSVLASLTDRLAKYAAADEGVMQRLLEGGAFGKFKSAIEQVTEVHSDMAASDLIELYMALLHFTESVYPNNMGHVNDLLDACHQTLAAKGLGPDPKAERQLLALLAMPLKKHNVVEVLGLDKYPSLMALLRPATRKDMAVKIVQTVVSVRGVPNALGVPVTSVIPVM